VFGSDQGLCGTFNEQVVDRVRADVASGAVASPRLRLHALGGRVAARLAEAGLAPEGETTLPLSPSLLAGLVQDLLLLVDGWRADGDLERVLLYVNRPLSTGAAEPHRSTLLPITWERLGRQPWPTRMLPLHTVDRPVLLAALLHHHLFVRLHQALAFSLATEHAARLMAMQAAERNIDERLDELRSQYHDQRQTAITAELLDIVSGAEALAGAGP
jgi:F-type H+-transporting ATPase subunit gamma